MKKIFIALFGFVALVGYGQDIIIKKNADEIKAKVVEVGIDNIKYKNFDNPEGPTYVIPKYELFMIRYENGNKDVFKDVTQEQKKEKVKKEKIKEDYNKLYVGFFGGPNYSKVYNVGQSSETVMSNSDWMCTTGINTEYFLTKNVSLNTGLFFKSVARYSIFPNSIETAYNTINIPLTAKFSFGNKTKFYVNTGLNLGFFISNEIYTKDFYKSNDFNFIFGLGLLREINERITVNLELRESLGLVTINQPFYIGGTISNYAERTQAVSLLVVLSYAIK